MDGRLARPLDVEMSSNYKQVQCEVYIRREGRRRAVIVV